MIELIFQMLWDFRRSHPMQRPGTLYINYLWYRVLLRECRSYQGILPIITPLTIFGMYIEPEYTYGAWARIEPR